MVLSLISLLSERQWYYLRQLRREDLTGSLLVGYSFISLGGLPPFLGFFPKWGVLVERVGLNSLFLRRVVIGTRLVALFYYVRARLGIFLNIKGRSLRIKELRGKRRLVLVLNLVGI
jgi:NADH-ubiquinone oxidoreductase chain 2